MKYDELSDEQILSLIKYDPKTLIVSSHESKKIEFKENFNFGYKKDYFKAMASFANSAGGYIIFGITDKPRLLKGLDKKHLNEFDNMKLEDFTVDLNNFFSPEIIWNTKIVAINDEIKIGVIYVNQSENKPVICKKRYESSDKKKSIVEGDIYYRYFARNEKIHYDDLLKILNEEKEKESKKWIDLFSKISKVGVDNVGLLNFNNGIISVENKSILLDEKMLSNIKFIKEGEFKEREGIPTLNVIGNVELKQGELILSPNQVKVKGIRFSDIIFDFLEQKDVSNPIDYITQICHESSGYLPLYYYISKSNKQKNEIIDIINKEIVRSQAKNMLLNRLSSNKIESIKLSKTGSKYQYCKDIINHIIKSDIVYIEEKYDVYKTLNAILVMNRKEINNNKDLLFRIMKSYYNQYYQIDPKFPGIFRKALCWIDEALYMPQSR